ncbi:TrkH family potassium uptake protein [Flexivirga meconopsidis]|uniref:TrkH family potassium uptake protein n=1 Tax=Flexivirga meconopsidis TaxID=2977121 RepID=UPI00223F8383|nr:potassium transporter TrkG [Flexivirga meconopsidis]
MNSTAFGPARLVVGFYLVAVTVGTALLMLPYAKAGPGGAELSVALFTATSATCITGMSTVDVATYWTPLGQTIILALVQVGGLGIVTITTLLILMVRGRLGLQDTLAAQTDSHAATTGEVRRVLLRIARFFLVFEAIIATFLTIRFRIGYDDNWPDALWHGVFHGISSVNNAGFSNLPQGLLPFVGDLWIVGPMCAAVFVGGLGYPVWFGLRRQWRTPRKWTVHLRLTVWGSLVLLAVGLVSFAAFEWTNPGTLGRLDLGDKLVASLAGGVFPRTAGFNTVDYGLIRPETMMLHYVLMFIGGGSAGTAGGIKVTTFLVLAAVIWSEVRGERQVVVGRRAIPLSVQRQALTIALLGVATVMVGAIAVVTLSGETLQLSLFEVISAFSTTGLSANLTAELPVSAQVVLMTLMFLGRVGTITVASALAMRRTRRRYELPEERPIVG